MQQVPYSRIFSQVQNFTKMPYLLAHIKAWVNERAYNGGYTDIIESVDSICRDSADTQYMLIQTNFSKSPKQLTYKPL